MEKHAFSPAMITAGQEALLCSKKEIDMSERQAKRQRRAERKAAATHEAIPPRPPLGASPHLTGQPSVASSHLAIALSAAVPLRVLGLYERQGPDKNDLEAAHHVGTLLASKGDRLLFRSEVRGETADIFNQTAQALAVLSFAPGGVTCFGHHFDAQKSSPDSLELKRQNATVSR